MTEASQWVVLSMQPTKCAFVTIDIESFVGVIEELLQSEIVKIWWPQLLSQSFVLVGVTSQETCAVAFVYY